MTFGVQLREDRLHHFLVPFARGADEVIIGQLKLRDEAFPGHGEVVAISLRLLSLGNGRLLHLLAVLIQTGKEKHLVTEAAPSTGDHVRNDFLVGMAEVRLPIDIINRGCDVETLAHLALLWSTNLRLATARKTGSLRTVQLEATSSYGVALALPA